METLLIILISLGVTVFFILGVPIFLVIGFWVIGVSLVIDFTLANIGVTLYEGLNFFGLLALPLFILTGDLIKGAGIAKRGDFWKRVPMGGEAAYNWGDWKIQPGEDPTDTVKDPEHRDFFIDIQIFHKQFL